MTNSVDALVKDLNTKIAAAVSAAHAAGRESALAELRSVLGTASSGAGAAGAKKTASKKAGAKSGGAPKTAKPAGKRKNPWAKLTPEQRLARVNAIRKGRGLPLKTAL